MNTRERIVVLLRSKRQALKGLQADIAAISEGLESGNIPFFLLDEADKEIPVTEQHPIREVKCGPYEGTIHGSIVKCLGIFGNVREAEIAASIFQNDPPSLAEIKSVQEALRKRPHLFKSECEGLFWSLVEDEPTPTTPSTPQEYLDAIEAILKRDGPLTSHAIARALSSPGSQFHVTLAEVEAVLYASPRFTQDDTEMFWELVDADPEEFDDHDLENPTIKGGDYQGMKVSHAAWEFLKRNPPSSVTAIASKIFPDTPSTSQVSVLTDALCNSRAFVSNGGFWSLVLVPLHESIQEFWSSDSTDESELEQPQPSGEYDGMTIPEAIKNVLGKVSTTAKVIAGIIFSDPCPSTAERAAAKAVLESDPAFKNETGLWELVDDEAPEYEPRLIMRGPYKDKSVKVAAKDFMRGNGSLPLVAIASTIFHKMHPNESERAAVNAALRSDPQFHSEGYGFWSVNEEPCPTHRPDDPWAFHIKGGPYDGLTVVYAARHYLLNHGPKSLNAIAKHIFGGPVSVLNIMAVTQAVYENESTFSCHDAGLWALPMNAGELSE